MPGKPVCLSIGGFDPSGGAGVIVDAFTFAAFDCVPTTAVTSITFQNVYKVVGAMHQPADAVRTQIETVLEQYEIAAVKTGMLPTREIIGVVAKAITLHRLTNVVVDPVISASSGYQLIENDALSAMIDHLLPLADLITPNLSEAVQLSGLNIVRADDIAAAAAKLHSLGAKNVLIKGGHLPAGEQVHQYQATDRLFDGADMTAFEGPFIENLSLRGTGCRLASAIACGFAQGGTIPEAVAAAKEFVRQAILTDGIPTLSRR
jgi:hydroxymethylpyrimidine kinase/phosphomethylpyrimidine kinase